MVLAMALNRVKIGSFVKQLKVKCNIPNLTSDKVSGINREKEFFEPSKQVGNNTSNYKIVPANFFACNLMHVGRDIVLPIALNCSMENKIVSPAYTVFQILDETIILKEFFFIMIKSSEKDRYFWFHTDSSVRDGMDWKDFCNLEFELPSIEIQQKYVDVYKSMIANKQAYENGLEDLKLVCDAYIENLRRTIPCEKIGKYLKESTLRNTAGKILNLQGLTNENGFQNPGSMSRNADLIKYKCVSYNNIVYPPPHFGQIGTIGIYKGDFCVVSPMYIVFMVVEENKLLPDYLMLWFRRKEFMRYAFFAACDSIRDTFDYNKLCDYQIPIPSIELQKEIVQIFNSLNERKDIKEKLNNVTNQICSILIKGSIEEAKRS
jgi:type I restriction enzyme S subunit